MYEVVTMGMALPQSLPGVVPNRLEPNILQARYFSPCWLGWYECSTADAKGAWAATG